MHSRSRDACLLLIGVARSRDISDRPGQQHTAKTRMSITEIRGSGIRSRSLRHKEYGLRFSRYCSKTRRIAAARRLTKRDILGRAIKALEFDCGRRILRRKTCESTDQSCKNSRLVIAENSLIALNSYRLRLWRCVTGYGRTASSSTASAPSCSSVHHPWLSRLRGTPSELRTRIGFWHLRLFAPGRPHTWRNTWQRYRNRWCK